MTETEKTILKAEIRERLLINQLKEFNNDFECLLSKIAERKRWDALVYSGNSMFLSEVKFRKFASDEYDSALIEKSKYDFLINRVQTDKGKELGVKCWYINFYTDGKVAIFNLKDFNPAFTPMKLPRCSASKYKAVKTKLAFKIPYEYATFYHMDFDSEQLERDVELQFQDYLLKSGQNGKN
jgi:hypothetical protein